jgi:hypothetical protein
MSQLACHRIVALGLLITVACGDSGSSGGGGSTTDGGGGSTTDGGGGSTTDGGGGAAGGTTADGGGGAAACLDFAATCDEATDTCCDVAGTPGECVAFGMGPKCSIPCPADPADCPNNGAGCNNMSPSYCKVN